MNKSRREADETIVELEEQKRETTKIRRDHDQELEKVENDELTVSVSSLRTKNRENITI